MLIRVVNSLICFPVYVQFRLFENLKAWLKTQRQINHVFHPIGKDERLLSVVHDIKILNAQVERDSLRRLKNFLYIMMIFALSFRASRPPPKKSFIPLNYFPFNLLSRYGIVVIHFLFSQSLILELRDLKLDPLNSISQVREKWLFLWLRS